MNDGSYRLNSSQINDRLNSSQINYASPQKSGNPPVSPMHYASPQKSNGGGYNNNNNNGLPQMSPMNYAPPPQKANLPSPMPMRVESTSSSSATLAAQLPAVYAQPSAHAQQSVHASSSPSHWEKTRALQSVVGNRLYEVNNVRMESKAASLTALSALDGKIVLCQYIDAALYFVWRSCCCD